MDTEEEPTLVLCDACMKCRSVATSAIADSERWTCCLQPAKKSANEGKKDDKRKGKAKAAESSASETTSFVHMRPCMHVRAHARALRFVCSACSCTRDLPTGLSTDDARSLQRCCDVPDAQARTRTLLARVRTALRALGGPRALHAPRALERYLPTCACVCVQVAEICGAHYALALGFAGHAAN